MTHVSLLIPCTSKGRNEWESIKDTYLMKFSLKSFLTTCDKDITYTYYIGFDKDDRIFSKQAEQDQIKRYETVFKNVTFKFLEFIDIPKGYVTKMWNVLFKQAYDDGCDYFYRSLPIFS